MKNQSIPWTPSWAPKGFQMPWSSQSPPVNRLFNPSEDTPRSYRMGMLKNRNEGVEESTKDWKGWGKGGEQMDEYSKGASKGWWGEVPTKSDFTPMKRFDSITPQNFAVWEAAVKRWVLVTDHPPRSRAIKLLDSLPIDLHLHFTNEDDMLQIEEAVRWVMDNVSLYIERRPGDDQTKLMDQIWKSNTRGIE